MPRSHQPKQRTESRDQLKFDNHSSNELLNSRRCLLMKIVLGSTTDHYLGHRSRRGADPNGIAQLPLGLTGITALLAHTCETDVVSLKWHVGPGETAIELATTQGELMIQKPIHILVLFVIAGPLTPTTPAVAQNDDEVVVAEHKRRMATMSKLIGEIRIFEQFDGREVELERSAMPVTHFKDDVRGFMDGTLWAFTRNGRPIALIKCSTKDSNSQLWWHTCASLSTNPLRCERANRTVWMPQEPGVEYHDLRPASPPASTSTRRRLQIRQLARRFSAHQFWNPDNQRFELRLSPRPILVYSDESNGVVDGGVFIFTHGVTPALALIIEAVGDKTDMSWRYAVAKQGSAEFGVLLDDEQVYQSPRALGVTGRSMDPYFLFSLREQQSN